MELNELLDALNAGHTITGDSPLHEVMHRTSQQALRITGELNGLYQEPARVRELLAQLTGKPVAESVTSRAAPSCGYASRCRRDRPQCVDRIQRHDPAGRNNRRQRGRGCGIGGDEGRAGEHRRCGLARSGGTLAGGHRQTLKLS